MEATEPIKAARAHAVPLAVACVASTLLFILMQTPARAVAITDDRNATASEVCAGDCDGDARVRIDELIRLVGIALERLDPGSCPSLPPVVTVDMLVRAVHAALHGCPRTVATETPTPTSTPTPLRPTAPSSTPTEGVTVSEPGIDLHPRRVVLARCLVTECLTVPADSGSVCVANRGSEDAGPFLVDVNGETQVLLDGLPSGVVRCFELPIRGSATVIVDPDDRVSESNEDNNEESFPGPGPTGCDVIVPPCTPTPTVTNVQSCVDCCSHCTTEVCFLTCFGVQGCRLITEWRGTVSDQSTGEPIAGAEVTVNGTTVTTDAEGDYSTTSVKAEVCNALDYLYEIAVVAPGYRRFVGRMYQSQVPGTRVQDVALEPVVASFVPATGIPWRTARASLVQRARPGLFALQIDEDAPVLLALPTGCRFDFLHDPFEPLQGIESIESFNDSIEVESDIVVYDDVAKPG
jgi:hypothetical protein